MTLCTLASPDLHRRIRSHSLHGLFVHMIGIGGSGMSGAAVMLQQLGAQVSGSDREGGAIVDGLRARGLGVAVGHAAEHLPAHTELAVISAAIPEANPELIRARALGLPVIKYAELISELSIARQGVAIAGTHGKSTTTAMCAHILRVAGLDPSFVFGATSQQLGGSSAIGKGEHFVVEACEYDRSFLRFAPHLAAILNIEPDHFDCYATLDELVEAFGRFAQRVDAMGLLVCNADAPWTLEAASQAACRVATFGKSEAANWRADAIGREDGLPSFDVLHYGRPLLNVRLGVPGMHNVWNAVAATAIAYEAGADPADIAVALESFKGVDRRLTWRGEYRGANIVDDYAHHPTEISVSIEAARRRYVPSRTWVVFQPHQHSRTTNLMNEFALSLLAADEVIVPNVYAARESGGNGEDVSSSTLVSRICNQGGRAAYIPTLDGVTEHLADKVGTGDLLLTMGAGDVWKVADALLARIRVSN